MGTLFEHYSKPNVLSAVHGMSKEDQWLTMTRTIDLEDLVVVVVVTLTLDGGDDLAGGHPQAPLASAETLEQGGREAEH